MNHILFGAAVSLTVISYLATIFPPAELNPQWAQAAALFLIASTLYYR